MKKVLKPNKIYTGIAFNWGERDGNCTPIMEFKLHGDRIVNLKFDHQVEIIVLFEENGERGFYRVDELELEQPDKEYTFEEMTKLLFEVKSLAFRPVGNKYDFVIKLTCRGTVGKFEDISSLHYLPLEISKEIKEMKYIKVVKE